MGLVGRVRALVVQRRILGLLIRRDLKVRYAGSFLGYLWTVLDPLLMILVYWFVFSIIFTGRRGSEQPFILYLAFGQLAWQWFNGAVIDSSRALVAEARLVRSTRLPREIWVLKIVGSKALEFVFSLPVLVMFMLVYGKAPSWHLVLFPVGIVLQAVLCTGIGLILAAVTVLVNDLSRVVRILLRLMFYATPILYSVDRVPNKYHLHQIYALNPMTGIVDLYRASVFSSQMAGPGTIAAAVVISFALLLLGLRVFGRLESVVLKEL
jgi:ABC-2 type transport system permease protein